MPVHRFAWQLENVSFIHLLHPHLRGRGRVGRCAASYFCRAYVLACLALLNQQYRLRPCLAPVKFHYTAKHCGDRPHCLEQPVLSRVVPAHLRGAGYVLRRKVKM